MLSLRDKFEELRLRLGSGRRLESTGSEPIFYLVFPVAGLQNLCRRNVMQSAEPPAPSMWPTE